MQPFFPHLPGRPPPANPAGGLPFWPAWPAPPVAAGSPVSPLDPARETSFGSSGTLGGGNVTAAAPASPAAPTLTSSSLSSTASAPLPQPPQGFVALPYRDQLGRPRFLFRARKPASAPLRDLDADLDGARGIQFPEPFEAEGRRDEFNGKEGQWRYYNDINRRMLAFAYLNPHLMQDMNKTELSALAHAHRDIELGKKGKRSKRAKSAGLPTPSPGCEAPGTPTGNEEVQSTGMKRRASAGDVDPWRSRTVLADGERPWYLSGQVQWIDGRFVVIPSLPSGHSGTTC
ncbi:hypothetical protein DFJ74DRAFT_726306 [Hyaloraphidium curvatum]|nr:hypothetical protein DFJ74DRAFT_726306 [Hyaloraphidium curvatum]